MAEINEHLRFDFSLEGERSNVVEDKTFQILVVGDWSGDADKVPLSKRKPFEIDRDEIDNGLKFFNTSIHLDNLGTRISFNSIDDFHPDALYDRLPVFTELRVLRKRLGDAETYHDAARELRKATVTEPLEKEDLDRGVAKESEPAGLLDAILSKTHDDASAPDFVSRDLSTLIGELVSPHLVAVDETEQAELLAAVDLAISELMRTILHDPKFQALESAWRGLSFLALRAETSSDLRIYAFDLSVAELAGDLRFAADLDNAFFNRLVGQGVNDEPWTAVFANHAFNSSVDDIATLIRVGQTVSRGDVPFIAHMRPDFLGVKSLSDDSDPRHWDLSGSTEGAKLWNAFRELPISQFIGLTIPRFIGRMPYGAHRDPIDSFDFEEFSNGLPHNEILWTNGCFAVAELVARSFTDFGWEMKKHLSQDIDDLPLVMYQIDGQRDYIPCGETLLSENASVQLQEQGLMPIVSFKNSNRIRLTKFQSCANPTTPLRGGWNR